VSPDDSGGSSGVDHTAWDPGLKLECEDQTVQQLHTGHEQNGKMPTTQLHMPVTAHMVAMRNADKACPLSGRNERCFRRTRSQEMDLDTWGRKRKIR